MVQIKLVGNEPGEKKKKKNNSFFTQQLPSIILQKGSN